LFFKLKIVSRHYKTPEVKHASHPNYASHPSTHIIAENPMGALEEEELLHQEEEPLPPLLPAASAPLAHGAHC
jgi:hypothetical protein